MKTKRNNIVYWLGKRYTSIYFTRREAECMVLLLQKCTYRQIGQALQLSPRTIEFYIHNMKAKLNCHTIDELITKVKASDFLANIDLMIANEKI